jgi:hypothetical protein
MLHGFLFAPTSIEPVARLYDLLAATIRGAGLPRTASALA